MKRRTKIILGSLAGLVALQFVTYFTLAKRSLVHVALRVRPEFTHFVEGTHFKWVCLYNLNTKAVDPDLAQFIKRAFEKRYEKVYYNIQDIPEEFVDRRVLGESRTVTDYKDGYTYSIAFDRPGFMNIVVSHRDREGSLAAYSGQEWYFWVLFRWVKVHTCRAEVS